MKAKDLQVGDVIRYGIHLTMMPAEEESGEWVKYEDHQAETTRLQAQIETLTKALDSTLYWVPQNEVNDVGFPELYAYLKAKETPTDTTSEVAG